MTRESGSAENVPATPTPGPDVWQALRATTRARIGLPRSGDAQATSALLAFQASHAAARDAVLQPLDVDDLAEHLADLGDPVVVRSRAESREEYVRRPDLGRRPDDLAHLTPPGSGSEGYDVAIVVADGLSPRGVQTHAAALVREILDALPEEFSVAPPVIATQARVALGDHIGQALQARTVLVIIGERPGLSVSESVGIYLTHDPRPGRADSQRNCISNIHPPHGLSYRAAARTAANLVIGARRLGASGVALKDGAAPAMAIEETERPAETGQTVAT